MSVRDPYSPPTVNGTLILVLGILSVIGFPFLGPVAWIMGNNAMRTLNSFASDPAQRTNANAGRICGIVGTVFLMIGILSLVVFFAFETLIIKEMNRQSHAPGITTITSPSNGTTTSSAASSDPSGEAVMTGDTAKMKVMLANDPSLANKKGPTGETSLFNAAFFGQKDAVSLLIEQGVDVNTKNSFGETALDRAQDFHKEDIVTLLKSHGAVSGKK